MRLNGRTIGWAFSGSHHTMPQILPVVRAARREGADVIPVISQALASTRTRHGAPEDWVSLLSEITGRVPLTEIPEVEPFGPEKTCDLVALAPCTGNSMARLANAITDGAALMACKAQLRNGRPLVVSITTNDGLGLNAKNLAVLLNTPNLYLVPFGQDSPNGKPKSLVAHLELLLATMEAALEGRQLQPVLLPW